MSDFTGDNHLAEVPIVDLDEEPVAQDKLDRVMQLARLQVEQQLAVSKAESALEKAEAALRQTSENDLPLAMAEAHMSDFTLDTGEGIEIEKQIFAGIPKDRATEAFEWFVQEGHEDLIKHEIKITLPKGTTDVVERIKRSLKKFNDELPSKKKFKMDDKETVHYQTLQKFVRDAEAAERELPEELLGVYRRRVAKLTSPEEPSF
jgi:hypothetical protein